MHGSIPAVTIPPRAHSRGFAFFSSLGVLFPSSGHKERGNSPPPRHLKTNCTVSQEDGNIYDIFYVLQNKATWTRIIPAYYMYAKVKKHISHCFCFSSVFLLSCGFSNTGFINLDKLFNSKQSLTNWRDIDFPAKKSANWGPCGWMPIFAP